MQRTTLNGGANETFGNHDAALIREGPYFNLFHIRTP
jgi:hypothetical protein